ncbi:MAG: T9SS type A sorting domain-containing protein, partial [Olleya sp.]
ALSVDEFTLDNLSIFPNPNNGEFTVKFSNATGKVSLEVFDIRGRKVVGNNYDIIGDFNQNVSLANIQSGMYLLNINDGSRIITKKIIVE